MTVLHGLLVDLEPFTDEWPDKMLQHWNNESRLWASMGAWGPVSRAEIERISEQRAGAHERGYTGVHFMMRARDGNVIGSIGINWVNVTSRLAFMGAWIGEEAYWSGGHGTDALLLVVDYAFRWLDVRRLALSTMALNERAQRNVEKCGFKLEARERRATLVQGRWVDVVSYGMLREEWPGRETLVEKLDLRARALARYGAAVPHA